MSKTIVTFMALLANKFNVNSRTECILTEAGIDFVRAKTGFEFLFKRLTKQEYAATVNRLVGRFNIEMQHFH